MIRNVQIARDLGYLDLPDAMLVDQRDMTGSPTATMVVLTTGAQGEPMAALSRIANGTHRTIEVGLATWSSSRRTRSRATSAGSRAP